MVGHHILILFFSIVIIDLANSVPKFARSKIETNNLIKEWARQGLAQSVENPEVKSNEQVQDKIDSPPSIDKVNVDENAQDHNKNHDSEVKDTYDNQQKDDQGENSRDDDEYYDDIKDFLDKKEEEALASNSEEYIDLNSTEYELDDKLTLQGKRPVRAGDIFTVQEMLPIAKRLMRKVTSRVGEGKGKGVISGAKDAKSLTDVLFERFFLTSRRIVKIKAMDISALDALQALALSGGSVSQAVLRSAIKFKSKFTQDFTELPFKKNAATVTNIKPIRKCHYKLLGKNIIQRRGNRALRKNAKTLRRVDLSKKLGRNRKLVVNPSRRGPAAMRSENRKPQKQNKRKIKSSKKTNFKPSNRGHGGNFKRPEKLKLLLKPSGASKANNICRWRYECRYPPILESCRLYVDCSEEAKSAKNYIGLKVADDEHTPALKKFRRMVGVDLIDEEVEKLLERRYLALKPKSNIETENVQSLAEYFNQIVIRDILDQNQKPYSTPIPLKDPNVVDMTTYSLKDEEEVTEQQYDATPGPHQDQPDDEIIQENGDEYETTEPAPDQTGEEIIQENGEEYETTEPAQDQTDDEAYSENAGYETTELAQEAGVESNIEIKNLNRRILPGKLARTKKPKT